MYLVNKEVKGKKYCWELKEDAEDQKLQLIDFFSKLFSGKDDVGYPTEDHTVDDIVDRINWASDGSWDLQVSKPEDAEELYNI